MDRKPNSRPVNAFSALFASVPVALALTLGVIVEFDLSLLWSLPLYALLGSLLMTAILLIGYAGASDDDL